MTERRFPTFTLPLPLVQRMADILGKLPHNQVHAVLSELAKYRPDPPAASRQIVGDTPPGDGDSDQHTEGDTPKPH